MKKILLLLLTASLCVSLCACGGSGADTGSSGDGGKGNSGTALTLDNYENYFDVSASIGKGHTTMCEYKGQYLDLVKTLECSIAFEGNSNYEYTDVVFTIKFVHTGPTKFIEFYDDATITVSVNLAGNGSGSCYVETPVAQTAWDNISNEIYAFYRPAEISVAMDYSSYEIINVTGTATKN